MGFRDLGDINSIIIDTVTHMGAKQGVAYVSSKRIAASCGISSATIFNRFTSIRNLLDRAAEQFDRPRMEQAARLVEQGLSPQDIWDRMMESFLADPESTLYYISYTSTFGFDPTSANPRAKEFLRIAKAFFRSGRALEDHEYLLLWDYITSMEFYYAEKFIHGLIPSTSEERVLVKRIVFGGIDGLLKK